MSRIATRTIQTLVDLLVLSLAFWAAFLLRFDGDLPIQMLKRLLFTWPYVLLFEMAVFALFGVPRFAWRYVGLRETARILWATSIVAAVLLAARFGAGAVQQHWGYAQYAFIPIGVIAGNFAFSFIGITGVRAARRWLGERSSSHARRLLHIERTPTLLLGAGQGGMMVAREIAGRPELGIEPLGFLDDDTTKIGTSIHGVAVLGRMDELGRIAKLTEAKQAIITIANAPGKTIRRLYQLCEEAGLRAKIIPGLYELLDGKVSLQRIRDVSIEDLLGRDEVTLDTDLVRSFVENRCVLVTGAGGSIGSEICRQVARHGPSELVLVERTEYALFTIQQELGRAFPTLTIKPRICDVCDLERVESVFAESLPEVVFHAAAHKHVPMMEENPGEAIKNNVFGTKAVADAAHRHRAQAFVLISTDKAVNPSSIMGATKRVAEMYVQCLSSASTTKFVAVRFGNVLGSTGSVIPTFKAQIAAGGPVTVTHPEMQRYFMTIPEASQLVLQAAAMGAGGEIFVLDMGESVHIVDLAHQLIRLSGFTPGVDIEVRFTGVRPGEKLFEELSFDAERMSKTAHPKIHIGHLTPSTRAALAAGLELLTRAAASGSTVEVRAALRQVVPEMLPESRPEAAETGLAAEKEPAPLAATA